MFSLTFPAVGTLAPSPPSVGYPPPTYSPLGGYSPPAYPPSSGYPSAPYQPGHMSSMGAMLAEGVSPSDATDVPNKEEQNW